MKIHEYQAKRLLAARGVAVPRGEPAATPAEARAIAEAIGPRVVLKAQIHAGGRGRAGGIRMAGSPEEADRLARDMLGMTLVTPQTGPGGRTVKRLLVEEALDVGRELYLGVAVDRQAGSVVLLASTDGGVDIEKTAAERPEAIFRETVDPGLGLPAFQARRLAFRLGLAGETHRRAVEFIDALTAAFASTDAALAEINPLAVTASGAVLALDAKMDFDDNALARRPEIRALRDLDEESPLEVEASAHNLSYVKLDGNIGCLVNGAGLAMATMDIILLAGGRPANFLDVGGGVTKDAAAHAFRILASDADVRGALVNIFGGIVRCDLIAAGVVEAARALGTTFPVVIRLEGTNEKEGKRILGESGLAFFPAEGMKDAAEKIVALVARAGNRETP
jgi:succinyl-CoA synthetase beta subunit